MDFDFLLNKGFSESEIEQMQGFYYSAVGGQAPAFWFDLCSNLLLAMLIAMFLPKLFPERTEDSVGFSRVMKCFLMVTFAPVLIYWVPTAFYIGDTLITPFCHGLVSYTESFCLLLISASFWQVAAQVATVFLFLMLLVLFVQAHRKVVEFTFYDYCLCAAWGAAFVAIFAAILGIILSLVVEIYLLVIGLISYIPIIFLTLLYFGKCLSMHILGCLVFTTPKHFEVFVMVILSVVLYIGFRKLSSKNKVRFG